MSINVGQLSNHYFSETYTYDGPHDVPTCIMLTCYNEQKLIKQKVDNSAESFRALMQPDCINWFQIKSLTDYKVVSRLMKEFGLTNLNIKDVMTTEEVVKIQLNEDSIFIVLSNCSMTEKEKIHSEHICIYVTPQVVITFTESHHNFFENAENTLNNNSFGIRSAQSGMLAAFLINAITGDMIETSLRVEKMLEKMEGTLLQNQYNQKDIGTKIQDYLHAFLVINKNTVPMGDEFHKLMKPKEGIIDNSMLAIYEEIFDQFEYIIQTTENNKHLITSLIDLYVSNNDLRMNEVMKRLTVVSTLFIPITFLVGVWGMNFKHMPAIESEYGYIIGWIILLATAATTWIFMKRKNWF